MVTPEGAVKVLGLGETLPKTLSAGGTPAAAYYLAPEQVRGHAPDGATDLYALGVVLYEAATGVVPFEGPDAGSVATAHVEREPEPLRRVNPGVPASLEVAVLRALRKDPKERYRSLDAFRQELDRVADMIQSGTGEAEAEAHAAQEAPALGGDHDHHRDRGPAGGRRRRRLRCGGATTWLEYPRSSVSRPMRHARPWPSPA